MPYIPAESVALLFLLHITSVLENNQPATIVDACVTGLAHTTGPLDFTDTCQRSSPAGRPRHAAHKAVSLTSMHAGSGACRTCFCSLRRVLERVLEHAGLACAR
eukprot:1149239-Pelagomonas_calceolata.AAC.2